MEAIKLNEELNYNLIIIDDEDIEFIKEVNSDYKLGKNREKEYISRFGIKLRQTLAFGETNDVSIKMLEKFIPEDHNPLAPKSKLKSYKCYATKNPSIVMHEDLKSSWACLMNKLGNPTYVLIFEGKQL